MKPHSENTSVDIQPAYLHKANDFKTTKANVLRSASIDIISVPLFLSIAVIIVFELLGIFRSFSQSEISITTFFLEHVVHLILASIMLAVMNAVRLHLGLPFHWRRYAASHIDLFLILGLISYGLVSIFSIPSHLSGTLSPQYTWGVFLLLHLQILMLGRFLFLRAVLHNPRSWSRACYNTL